jgi:hypothetical protein
MGVKTYLDAIANGRGMAKSNLFSVYFSGGLIDNAVDGKSPLNSKYGNLNVKVNASTSRVGERILLMCDEVTLPGVQSSTGNVKRHPGANPTYYPTNIIYNDIQLSFMCDAEMKSLSFFNDWYDRIYNVQGSGKNKSYRLNYNNEYQCDIIIEKNDRDKNSEIGLVAAKYTLYGAWLYAIDQIPLSYGSTQLVKATANFYYSNWDVEFPPLPTLT